MFRPDPNPRAFPSSAIDDRFGGMSMWDYFAGQALAGVLAGDTAFGPILQGNADTIAASSATFADAMMVVRHKRIEERAEADAAEKQLATNPAPLCVDAEVMRLDLQAIGAAISVQSWQGVERAYNRFRDRMEVASRG